MVNHSDAEALGALYDRYFDAFNRQDVDALEAMYVAPVMIGGGGRVPIRIPDAAAFRQHMRASMENLKKAGWHQSVLEHAYVAVMAGDTGIVTAHYRRNRADGSEIESGTANYIARKLGGEWRFVGITAP